MAHSSPIAAQVKTWKDVREVVSHHNPVLGKIIDDIDPDDTNKFYHVKYRYGDKFLDKGRFYLPTESGDFVELNDTLEPKEVRDDLGYSLFTNPVMIPLKNTMELFIEVENRIVPFMLAGPGSIFGTSRVLDELDFTGPSHASKSLWDMTAGARSTFMLPKISDNTAHTRLLKHYGFNIEKPRELADHWYVFRQLANCRDFAEPWEFEVLLLSRQWFSRLNDPRWQELKTFCLQQNRRAFSFWHHIASWQITFSRIQHLKHIKASPHMIDTVKHLFMIASGAVPGFRPADSNKIAPIAGIQEAYINHYDIAYKPIIMAPHVMNTADSLPTYYSLQYPTAIEYAPKSSGGTSTINDLDELSTLMRKYLSQVVNPDLNQSGTSLEMLGQQLKVKYYHTNPDRYDGILPADDVLCEDKAFDSLLYQTDKPLDFARNSTFIKGCVKLEFSNERADT